MNTLSTREMAMKAILETARKDERLVIVSPDAMLAARRCPFRKSFPTALSRWASRSNAPWIWRQGWRRWA